MSKSYLLLGDFCQKIDQPAGLFDRLRCYASRYRARSAPAGAPGRRTNIPRIQVYLFPAIALSVLWLAGCQALLPQGTDSHYVFPPEGTRLVVTEPLPIQPGWARVFLQQGAALPYSGVNWYYPSCNFEVQRVLETPQDVPPGNYLVVRVYRDREEVVQRHPLKLASLVLVSGEDGGGSVMWHETVHMKLQGETSSEVRRLSCRGGFDDAPRALPPSINEIREALGSKVILELPK